MLTPHEATILHGRVLVRAQQPTPVGRALVAIVTAHSPDAVDGYGKAHCRADLAGYPCLTIETAATELDVELPAGSSQ